MNQWYEVSESRRSFKKHFQATNFEFGDVLVSSDLILPNEQSNKHRK